MACHAKVSRTPVSSSTSVASTAVAAPDEINVVVVATDTFSSRNQNTTTEGALAAWSAVAGQSSRRWVPGDGHRRRGVRLPVRG